MRLVGNTGGERKFDILKTFKGQTLSILTDQVSLFGAQSALKVGPQALGRVLLGAAADASLGGDDNDRVRRNRVQIRAISTALGRALAAADIRQTRLPPSQAVLLTQQAAIIGNCNLTTGGLGIAPHSRLGYVQQTGSEAELADGQPVV